MSAHAGGSFQDPLWRRSNSFNKTRLDHSVSYSFQADIPTRIRSLLLSRQTRNPPRTPWPSDEMTPHHQEDLDIIQTSGSSFTSGVVETTRIQSALPSVSFNLPLASSYNPELLSAFEVKKRSCHLTSSSSHEPLGTISSFDGTDATITNPIIDDATINQTLVQSCNLSPPNKTMKNIVSITDLASEFGTHINPDDCPIGTPFTVTGFDRAIKDTLSSNFQFVFRGETPLNLPDPSKRLSASRPSLRLEDFATSKTSPRSSAHRHTLLKSSVTPGEMIDLGTPVQPVLIRTPETLSTLGKLEDNCNTGAGHNHTHLLVTPIEALTSILELPRGEKHVACEKSKISHYNMQDRSIDSSNLSKVKPEIEGPIRNPMIPGMNQTISYATTETNYVDGAHPKAAPESLAEAALTAEEYLRQNEKVHSQPSTIVEEDTASFENLTPPEFSDIRVPVSQTEKFDGESQTRGWNIAKRNQYSKEPQFKYSPIPRKFSLDGSAQVSSSNFGSALPRNNLLEHLISRADKGVRTSSSTTANNVKNLTVPKQSSTGNHVREINLKNRFDNSLRARWRRELYSRNELYNSRLTAIPPRKYRLPKAMSSPARGSESRSDVGVKHSELEASKTFDKTINHLEHLMSEALYIAQQPDLREGSEQAPGLLHKTVALDDTIRQREYSTGRLYSVLRSVLHSQLSDMLSYKESVHESFANDSSDGASYDSETNSSILEDCYHMAPSSFTNPSDGNTVVTPLAQPILSLDRPPTPQAIPNPVSLGSVTPVLLPNHIQAHIPDQESNSGNVSIISMAVGVPTIRDGNTESSVYSKIENASELALDEHRSRERVIAIKSNRHIPMRKDIQPIIQPYEEDDPMIIRARGSTKAILNKREVTEFIRVFHEPPIQSRHSSLALRKIVDNATQPVGLTSAIELESNRVARKVPGKRSLQNYSLRTLSISQGSLSEVDFSTPLDPGGQTALTNHPAMKNVVELKELNEAIESSPKRHISGRSLQDKISQLKHDKFAHLSLRGKSHISLHDHSGFSLSRSHRRQPIARDWSPGRKRFTASVACISTALIGLLIGIYAGEVPSIQYYIADFNHYSILGNVFFFITLAITTFLFWPLPLLHGRKPYILAALTLAMPLLFPQAISVSMQRSPYVSTWRVMLILPRTVMGAALGFANINFMATLTDLFGASLQSRNPHQETVNNFDVRRHGGGLGVWLGIWTWCYVGSIGVGFLIGAVVINTLSPDWGFYISIVIIAAVLLLNVVTPEVRRSAYRRSVTEVRTSKDISRRLARGEVMMHRRQTGPKWWGEEFHQGVMLSLDMLRQPGFLIMSLYVAWMYGQIVLTIVLLGSLMSKYYRFTSPAVGATTMAIPLGGLLAVPFQKASLFSRARRNPQRTDSMTFDTKVTFSSHLIRRAIFTLVLPFAGLAYTLSSSGPPTPFILPVFFAGLIGFLSNLAIAECSGIIMETFDTSDLQPGMTGRPRGASGERTRHKRTNYSSFPRVSSAFAIIHALGFLIGAAATGIGGVAERHIGQQAATGVMAGILLILTLGVLGILYRFKEVQIIPSHNKEEMKKWERERKMSVQRNEETIRRGAVEDPTPEWEESWRPIIIGNPSGKTRRMSVLELGHLSRWSEIRRKNKLVDETSREAQYPNLVTLEDVRKEIRDKSLAGLHRAGSKRSQRSRRSKLNQGSEEPELDVEVDLGKRNKSA